MMMQLREERAAMMRGWQQGMVSDSRLNKALRIEKHRRRMRFEPNH